MTNPSLTGRLADAGEAMSVIHQTRLDQAQETHQ